MKITRYSQSLLLSRSTANELCIVIGESPELSAVPVNEYNTLYMHCQKKLIEGIIIIIIIVICNVSIETNIRFL